MQELRRLFWADVPLGTLDGLLLDLWVQAGRLRVLSVCTGSRGLLGPAGPTALLLPVLDGHVPSSARALQGSKHCLGWVPGPKPWNPLHTAIYIHRQT